MLYYFLMVRFFNISFSTELEIVLVFVVLLVLVFLYVMKILLNKEVVQAYNKGEEVVGIIKFGHLV